MTARLRLLVAQTDPGRLLGSPVAPLPVGVVRFPLGQVAIVVKGTFTYSGNGAIEVARPCASQKPLSTGEVSTLRGAEEGELSYPSDFVRYKPVADVLLSGHAHGPRAEPQIDASIKVGRVSRTVSLVGSPAAEMPLLRGFLRAEGGEGRTDPVGPMAPVDLEDGETDLGLASDEELAADAARYVALFDKGELSANEEGVETTELIRAGGVSFAAPSQRTRYLKPGMTIELSGLSPGGGRRVIKLPPLSPSVTLETSWGDAPVEMVCDTLWIDTDDETLILVWRGIAPLSKDGSEAQRLVVSLERDDDPRTQDAILSALPRGHFTYAEEEASLGEPSQESDELSLRAARYSTWGEPVEPDLTIEEYASVSAAIAAGRSPKSEVLAEHGLDDDGWLLEERAWLERMGDAAMAGDASVATKYGELFAAASAAALSDGEESLS